MTDIITPGSLAARILDHLRVAKGEFEAGELAEDLHVELREVRAALEALKKARAVSVRLDEGHPIYRAIGSEPKTIPGSAMKIIGETNPAKRETKAAPPEKKPAIPETEPPMPKHKAHLMTRPGHQEKVLAFLKATPGGASRQAVIKGTGLLVSQVRVALKTLHAEGKVGRDGNTSNAIWHMPGEKVDPAANVRAPASRAPRQAAAAKPAPDPSRVVESPARARNLAHFGPPTPSQDGFDFAVSSDGMFAIRPRGTGEPVKMGPGEVEEMIDFLTRTQHVWRPQA